MLGGWLRGAGLGLSFCTDSRAVPRVHDWDPQPRATQKVSVCVQQWWGKGKGQGVVSHGLWTSRSLGVILVKVEPLQGGGFGCGGKCSTGTVPGNDCVQASKKCPGTRVTLGAEEVLVALGYPVGAGVG